MRRNIKTMRPSDKLDAKKLGPFVIEAKVGSAAYRLTLPGTMQVHPTFHVSLLEKYAPNTHPQRQIEAPAPPVVAPNGQLAYEVEEILDSRTHHGKLDYFVHWKGYPVEESSWMWASDLPDEAEQVIDFHTRYPQKPGYNRLGRARHHVRRAHA